MYSVKSRNRTLKLLKTTEKKLTELRGTNKFNYKRKTKNLNFFFSKLRIYQTHWVQWKLQGNDHDQISSPMERKVRVNDSRSTHLLDQ